MEMTDATCHRHIKRGTKNKELLIKRLNRIDGQIKGIKKMLNEDIYCNNILMELVAVEKALQNVTNIILEDHLYNCVASDLEKGNTEVIEEIISLFKRFNK